MAAHESGGAGDRDGMHPHTLTAWPIRLNLETPKSPTKTAGTNPPVPGLPPFLFGGPGGADFDPANFDLSQIDLSQVMRILQSTGPVNWEVARQAAEQVALEGRPEPSVAAADRSAARGARPRRADPRRRRDRPHRRPSPPRSPPSGPKGWVDLHLVALEAGARGAGHHPRRGHAGRRRTTTPTTSSPPMAAGSG